MVDAPQYAPHLYDPDEPQDRPEDMQAFADAFAQLMGLTIAQDAEHDVSDEPRKADGEWTDEGGGAAKAVKPDREALIAKKKDLIAQSKPLGDKGSLTASEGRKFSGMMRQINDINWDLARPLDPAKVADIPNNTMKPEVIVAAQADLRKSKPIYDAICDAANGVSFDADTAIDKIMDGKDPNVTPVQFYAEFDATRAAMAAQYGDAVTLYRATGLQKDKATTNWATTEAYAKQFGSNVISKQIPIKDILAVNVGLYGKYHEVIVGDNPPESAKSTFTPPVKTTKVYKLFDQRKDGKLYPLFIGKNEPTEIGKWIAANFIPTKGYSERPGWHAGVLPIAPHLRTKTNRIADGRVWAECEMPDDRTDEWQAKADAQPRHDIRGEVPVGGHYRFKTSKMQGGAWMIGGALKVNKLLTNDEVVDLLTTHGYSREEAMRETRSENASHAQDSWFSSEPRKADGEWTSGGAGGEEKKTEPTAWQKVTGSEELSPLLQRIVPAVQDRSTGKMHIGDRGEWHELIAERNGLDTPLGGNVAYTRSWYDPLTKKFMDTEEMEKAAAGTYVDASTFMTEAQMDKYQDWYAEKEYARKKALGIDCDVIRAQDGWIESQHPRGQPQNKGEFASEPGGGSTATPAPGAWKEPAQPSRPAQTVAGAPPTSTVAAGKWKEGYHAYAPASALYAASAKQVPTEKHAALGAKLAEEVGVADKIARAKKMLSNAVPTDAPVSQGGFMQSDGSYTPERRAIHRDVLRKIFTPEAIASATPVEGRKPVMTVLGGRGGSGKSWLTGEQGPVHRGHTIVIDADAIKAALPEYKGWNASLLHEESSHVVSLAAHMAKALGVNVTFDATMNTGKSLAKRIAMFAGSNYDVHGYYMYASPEVAARRALGRFKAGGETGRFVPPEVILSNTENEKNFDAMIPQFRHWAIYDNNGDTGPKYVAGDT